MNTLFNFRKILTSDLVKQRSSNTHLLPTIESIMRKSTIYSMSLHKNINQQFLSLSEYIMLIYVTYFSKY